MARTAKKSTAPVREPFGAFAVKSVDVSKREIEGYASTSDADHRDDIVLPFACKFDDPGDVGVFIGHDWRLGALPVGIPVEIKQDGERLYTRTRVFETPRGDELLKVAQERLDAGKPLGISIGYPTASVKSRYEVKDGRRVRIISELALAEYSFTPIPMNEAAQVTAVKAITEMSDEEKRSAIRDSIRARTDGEAAYSYVVATFSSDVIVCDGDHFFRIPFTIDANGEAVLGDPVEQTWTDKASVTVDEAKAALRGAIETKAGARMSAPMLDKLKTIDGLVDELMSWAGYDEASEDSKSLADVLSLELALAGSR